MQIIEQSAVFVLTLAIVLNIIQLSVEENQYRMRRQDMGKAKVNIELCKGCFICVVNCPKKAISIQEKVNKNGYQTTMVDEALCIGCGACYKVCPDYVFEIRE